LTTYPIVPGHEIVGRVIEVGSHVTAYKLGDHVAVGCMVDSCQACNQCHQGQEQFCLKERTDTYNAPDRRSAAVDAVTFGGYAKHLVVREKFVLRIPDTLDLARTAPLLCAGITTYSPLRMWNVGPGSRVGVIGLGGLGHMAVKLAAGLGASVTVISRSPDKAADVAALGADQLLVSTDAEMLKQAMAQFDFILDTIPVKHDVNPYLPLLKVDGTLVMVGQLGPMEELSTFHMVLGRRRLAASFIGGIAQTQEMLNFCARKNILPDCEMINIDQVNEAYERMEQGDVRYRFVIDMSSLSSRPPLSWSQRLGLQPS
jgi:uncharacterized zinc-type alcohol dehydrogenase-like protein